jgi:isocitrate/isopropylmalate dehydrogenase
MLGLGLGQTSEARLLDDAVDAALERALTADRGGSATTGEFGDAVVAFLQSQPVRAA